jgi:putative membrane protein insertion efficiency factor
VVASGKARFYSSALMRRLVRFLVRAYQCTVSPVLSSIGGPGSGCRFTPTCSAYFLEAIETFGVAQGTWIGLKRLARCHPWGGHGYDPVAQPEHGPHRATATSFVCE